MDIQKKTLTGVQAFVSDREFRRKPRGTRDGGKFAAGRVSSEPAIELVEGESVGYEPDGSKAFEERSRRADNATTDDVVEPSVEPDVEVDIPLATVIEVEPIALGGSAEFSEGTWQFPPPWSDVDELARFFATVEISDSSIANIEAADRTGRDILAAESAFSQWRVTQPTLTRRYEKKHPKESAAQMAEAGRRSARLDKIRFEQGFIPRSELRDVARLGGFIISCDGLDQDARVKARRMRFRLGSGDIVEAGDIWAKYELREIAEAFFNRVKYQRAD
jgi:hypothetical protein